MIDHQTIQPAKGVHCGLHQCFAVRWRASSCSGGAANVLTTALCNQLLCLHFRRAVS